MKKFIVFAAVLTALFFISCTKTQIDPIQDTPEQAEARLAIDAVSNSFLSGSWGVTYCLNKNGDETAKYKNTSLGFATNNSIVLKGGTTMVGKWVVSYIDGKTRVSFSFISNSGFDALNGDWAMMDGGTALKMPLQNVMEQKCFLTIEKQ